MKNLLAIVTVFFLTISIGFSQMNIYQNMQNANVSVYNSISPKANIPVNNNTIVFSNSSQEAVTTTSDFTKEFRDLFKIVQQNQEDLGVFKNLLYNGEIPVNNDPSKGVINNPNMNLYRKNTLNNLNTYNYLEHLIKPNN